MSFSIPWLISPEPLWSGGHAVNRLVLSRLAAVYRSGLAYPGCPIPVALPRYTLYRSGKLMETEDV
ncbi:hypothetical protein DXT89_18350 [Agrobacterium vitis]|uniref:Uncharacterized protein n=1 Tax=Agrobacterium vitis TaxID=373 RepID=A0A368NHZ1_AGRVI|nr:hypothetical protein DXM22_16560 [Agrobacterium vitis]KAA3525293.1 hypothetical protein DXT89_18350 [Agrobacterium vitis]RCU50182.1 hypothetical protein ASB66_022595 [Agrobacterium vitis]